MNTNKRSTQIQNCEKYLSGHDKKRLAPQSYYDLQKNVEQL